MTTTYGLTPTGFVIKPIDVITASFVGPLQATFGTSLDFGPTTTEGQIIGVLANALAELWELLQAIVAGMDPDQATGFLLGALCALTATFAKPPSASSTTETLTGDPATVVPSGSQVQTVSTNALFATTADAALAALAAWASTTAYALADRVTNGGRCYVCTTAGTSAGSGGPTTSGTAITDGSVTWRFMGNGTAAADVLAVCSVTGPTIALSGDLASIVTPVAGWSSAINLLDADVGTNAMTDEQLRAFRTAELAAAGAGTPDAIRADLLEVTGVTAVTVFINDTDETNADSMPPHSVEALVTGGADQDVINALWKSAACGPQTTGTTTGTATDSQGFPHTVKFSRPATIDVYFRAFVTIYDGSDPTVAPIVTVYPSDGDDEVIAAIVTYGNAQPVGRDSVPRQLGAQAFGVDGVLDVTETQVWTSVIDNSPPAWTGTHAYSTADQTVNDGRQYVCTAGGTSAATGGPSTTGAAITDGSVTWRYLGAPLVITSRQKATYDSSRGEVVSTPGDP